MCNQAKWTRASCFIRRNFIADKTVRPHSNACLGAGMDHTQSARASVDNSRRSGESLNSSDSIFRLSMDAQRMSLDANPMPFGEAIRASHLNPCALHPLVMLPLDWGRTRPSSTPAHSLHTLGLYLVWMLGLACRASPSNVSKQWLSMRWCLSSTSAKSLSFGWFSTGSRQPAW